MLADSHHDASKELCPACLAIRYHTMCGCIYIHIHTWIALTRLCPVRTKKELFRLLNEEAEEVVLVGELEYFSHTHSLGLEIAQNRSYSFTSGPK